MALPADDRQLLTDASSARYGCWLVQKRSPSGLAGCLRLEACTMAPTSPPRVE